MNLKIRGYDVEFPYKPYGVQLGFMAKVLTALDKSENALLEAPTGCGKTASLLCSTLAWQREAKRKLEEGQKALLAKQEADAIQPPHGPLPLDTSDPANTAVAIVPKEEVAGGFLLPAPPPVSSLQQGVELNNNNGPPAAKPETMAIELGEGGFLPAEMQEKVPTVSQKQPKIIYTSRTHSQVRQVMREMKRCNMQASGLVLASKAHYCINDAAKKKGANVDESCENLRAENKCKYFRGIQDVLAHPDRHQLRDIEDLKAFGTEHDACPFFVSRRWAEEMDVIVGPYNYLADPVIRRSTKIEMENSVIIFDEAHNLEDTCREGASLDITYESLHEAQGALYRAQGTASGFKKSLYDPLIHMIGNIKRWIDSKESIALVERRKPAFRKTEPSFTLTYSGHDLLCELKAMVMEREHMEPLWTAYEAVRKEDEDITNSKEQSKSESQKRIKVGNGSLGTISRLLQLMKIMYERSEPTRDYKLIFQHIDYTSIEASKYRTSTPKGDSSTQLLFTSVLSLWCLHPAVAFKPIADAAHSVIVASGTLAPLNSFSSELGTSFKISLEGEHVIKGQKQVWAGVLMKSPSGYSLTCKRDTKNKPEFQKALGETILELSKVVPDGMLVFVPAYSLLESLETYWRRTGMWERLSKVKPILTEKRTGGEEQVKKTMAQHVGNIEAGKGSLFFAIHRGKVSEGVDFPDGLARAVVVVGIPFGNAGDLKIKYKQQYNDLNRSQLGLLSGRDWYQQNAFRALNQALGRCIRHKDDWGAVILVDERLSYESHQQMLSKWVRKELQDTDSVGDTVSELKDFFNNRSQIDFERHQQRLEAEEEAAAAALRLPPRCAIVPAVPPLESFADVAKRELELLKSWVAIDVRKYQEYALSIIESLEQEQDTEDFNNNKNENFQSIAAHGLVDNLVFAQVNLHNQEALIDALAVNILKDYATQAIVYAISGPDVDRWHERLQQMLPLDDVPREFAARLLLNAQGELIYPINDVMKTFIRVYCDEITAMGAGALLEKVDGLQELLMSGMEEDAKHDNPGDGEQHLPFGHNAVVPADGATHMDGVVGASLVGTKRSSPEEENDGLHPPEQRGVGEMRGTNGSSGRWSTDDNNTASAGNGLGDIGGGDGTLQPNSRPRK